MHCLSCGARTAVIDSRRAGGGSTIRRVRVCLGRCRGRFTTIEKRIDDDTAKVLIDGLELLSTQIADMISESGQYIVPDRKKRKGLPRSKRHR